MQRQNITVYNTVCLVVDGITYKENSRSRVAQCVSPFLFVLYMRHKIGPAHFRLLHVQGSRALLATLAELGTRTYVAETHGTPQHQSFDQTKDMRILQCLMRGTVDLSKSALVVSHFVSGGL